MTILSAGCAAPIPPKTYNTSWRHHMEHSVQDSAAYCDVFTWAYWLPVVQHTLPLNTQHSVRSSHETLSAGCATPASLKRSTMWRHHMKTSAGCPAPVRLGTTTHCDVIAWNHFPYYWLLVRGVHRRFLPADYLTKGQWFAPWGCFYIVTMIALSWKTTHKM